MEKVEEKDSKNNKENFRLNKYLAMCGVASRRKADEIIKQGRATINGKATTDLSTRIDPDNDVVAVDGEQVRAPNRHTYVLLNKPKDVITTVKDDKGRKTVIDLIPRRAQLYPVGRLDRNSTGVLILTNDGELAHRLMHPRYGVEKIYAVRLDKPLTEKDVKQLLKGVYIDGRIAKAENAVIVEGSKRFEARVTLKEGRNRQIRKMFEAINYKVRKLDRIVYAGLTTTGVRRGEWRNLTKNETISLKQKTKLSDD